MKIAIIGTGYVGLVTGVCLADSGNAVICVDIDKKKVEKLKKGEVPIYEPNLNKLLQRNRKAERISFTTELNVAVKKSDVVFLALPTPPDEDGSADLTHVLFVAEKIAPLIIKDKIIVNKSTVPVGTTEKIQKIIKQGASASFEVVSNPEFLREGYAVRDCLTPERIVIGTGSQKAKETLKRLYKPHVENTNQILFMDEKSAELTKYAANSFLATKISFMNEIANFCDLVGANVDDVRKGIGTDSRISKKFLYAGIGYGGSCFPKDVKALCKTGKDTKKEFKILEATVKVNEEQRMVLVKKIKKHFGKLEGKSFGVWGLSFKPNTDDVREAPSLYIIKELLKEGARVAAFDPEATENAKTVLGNKIIYTETMYDATKKQDALIIATEWAGFRNPDFDKLTKNLNNKIIFDGRNIFEREQVCEGFSSNFINNSISSRTYKYKT